MLQTLTVSLHLHCICGERGVGGLRAFDEVCYKYAQIQGAEVRDTVFLCVLNVLFCSASEKGVRKWYDASNRLDFVDNRVDV